MQKTFIRAYVYYVSVTSSDRIHLPFGPVVRQAMPNELFQFVYVYFGAAYHGDHFVPSSNTTLLITSVFWLSKTRRLIMLLTYYDYRYMLLFKTPHKLRRSYSTQNNVARVQILSPGNRSELKLYSIIVIKPLMNIDRSNSSTWATVIRMRCAVLYPAGQIWRYFLAFIDVVSNVYITSPEDVVLLPESVEHNSLCDDSYVKTV